MHVPLGQFSSFSFPFLINIKLFCLIPDHFQTNFLKKVRIQTKVQKKGPNGSIGYAKSSSCLTQLKVMLGWVELWLSWVFDKKFIIVFYKTFHVALDVPWIFTTFMLPWHPTSTDSTCCIWCSLFPMFNLSKVFEISNNDTPIEKWPYYLLM